MNLLINGSFEATMVGPGLTRVFPVEGNPYEVHFDNIWPPPGWDAWFFHEPGKWDKPEVHEAKSQHDARRVHSGNQAMCLFTFNRKHDAGFLQRVENVTAGARYRASAHAHAWSNHAFEHESDPFWSEGVGTGVHSLLIPDEIPMINGDKQNDAIGNFAFSVGIDPTGGTNPLAGTVVWGREVANYNGHQPVPAVEVVARGVPLTVFLRSSTLWAFKHNNSYWDDVTLEVVDDEEPPPPLTAGSSKLGPHVLRPAAGVGAYLDAGVPVVKFVDDFGMALQVRPKTLVVGRKYKGDYDAQLQYNSGKTPHQAAEQFVNDQVDTYTANPAITYWEGHNEPVWSTLQEMDWYAQFEMERMWLMADLGLKCVIGNFATGTPPLELWPAFVPACEVALDYRGILGLHEYGAAFMWWMTGDNQVDPDADQGDEGWTTLRYRKVYRQFLQPAGVGHLPLVITECGIDPMVRPEPPGWQAGAWRDMCSRWRDQLGENDCADYYFRQVTWYDEELQKDDYVVGATIFTWGSYEGSFQRFDVAGSGVADKLTQYNIDNPPRAFVYPGDGPPPDPEGRGLPRVQYARTYVLLPPDAGAEWARAVVDAIWDKARYTIGGSADDAGIGSLDDKTVIIINPHKWE